VGRDGRIEPAEYGRDGWLRLFSGERRMVQATKWGGMDGSSPLNGEGAGGLRGAPHDVLCTVGPLA
jgi:hypothetical protein